MTSNNNGYLSNAAISHKVLNNIAISAGANPGESADVIWSIISSRGLNQVLSKQFRKLNITTLEGFAEVPNEIFVTGEGSETGADINASMPFKQVASGEFEIYIKLEAGKNYIFIDRKSGTPRHFYTDDQVKLKEGTVESGMQVSKTGVYKINLDFNVATITAIEITKVGMFFSPSNSV